MDSSSLSRSERAWRAAGEFCRRNFDALSGLWSAKTGAAPPDSCRGLLLGAALAMGVASALAAGALLAHVTRPGAGGPLVRLPAVFTVLSADDPEDDASLYARDGWGRAVRQVFSAVAFRSGVFSEHGGRDADPDVPPQADPAALKKSGSGLVHFSDGRVSIETTDGSVPISRLRQAAGLTPAPALEPLELTLFAVSETGGNIPVPAYGESLDRNGNPVRWGWRNGDYPQKADRTCDFSEDMHAHVVRRMILGLTMPVPGSYYGLNQGQYHGFVSRYAEKYDLAVGLMLAIMHTESNFNPFAVSPSQAVGLMQIVPDTAGNEVYRYLMGTHGIPSMETLFSPEDNIKYGAVYLHLLSRRHFVGVRNEASRQMCVIAAYNGGPNAVLRLFDPDPDAAVARINALGPEQVYTALTTDMPSLETRRYVQIVMARMRNYSAN